MAGTHAKLSPSGAKRWLRCTPSASLEEVMPDKTSEAAEEGSFAHSLGEMLIRNRLGLITNNALADCMVNIKKAKYYNQAMQEYMEQYAAHVMEQFSVAQKHTPDALIRIEAKLDLTDYIEEGYGTGDVVIVADGVLDITDLKYGKGVEVSCVENEQMMIYALGALSELDMAYDIHDVRMTIYQPRLDNISSWSIKAEQLRTWGKEYLKPRAQMAFNGEGDFLPGDHCLFCRVKGSCRALADECQELAVYAFKEGPLLDDKEVADILSRMGLFNSWIKGVSEYALSEALKGKKFPGYKLVEGRSKRVYTNDDDVAKALKKGGFSEDDIYERSLLGITKMEKLITKPKFNALLSKLVIKPAGAPTLVDKNDPRSEYDSVQNAIDAFADDNEEDFTK